MRNYDGNRSNGASDEKSTDLSAEDTKNKDTPVTPTGNSVYGDTSPRKKEKSIYRKISSTEMEAAKNIGKSCMGSGDLALVPCDDPQVKNGYEMLRKILECGKLGDKSLTNVVSTEFIITFLENLKSIFINQPSCIEIDGPVNICGDIHGQFSDLLRLFDKSGFPQRCNYLFLGDYVDRGKHNLETILLLFSYKIIFPAHFFLLRGNHECPAINKVYGFYDECMRRYKVAKVWEAFQDTFSAMPLTAVIGERILCMHGGLSPKLRSIDQLRSIKRPIYQPESPSLEIDVLWSDPANFAKGWASNQRGVSFVFGADALRKVADELNIDLVVRAHQVVQDGYEFFANRRLVTIFSAPYYCGQFDNAAAIMTVSEDLMCSFLILRPRKKEARRKKGLAKS